LFRIIPSLPLYINHTISTLQQTRGDEHIDTAFGSKG